ncbi:hypothetical protein DNH61_03025 [Paenibacillus sambharensis]|uniref:DUF2500 domain-containing protein n=1 Tax=Paenibacillus sambharensis TaxID=1803190 RepID=A0A2W1LF74_9BACL|nr:DUF2500 domain-containing protein [Paenibacillus sambharensis]PZD97339.1 hypothetical protein DNH61_03025 [Paenibacillus sambharensis]
MRASAPLTGFVDMLLGLPWYFHILFIFVMSLTGGICLFLVIRWLLNVLHERINAERIVACSVVAKRTVAVRGVRGRREKHYITFEFRDRTRKELRVDANQFGEVIEGDKGSLTYQGTRYKAFIRVINLSTGGQNG